jgi:hypothetical protein
MLQENGPTIPREIMDCAGYVWQLEMISRVNLPIVISRGYLYEGCDEEWCYVDGE